MRFVIISYFLTMYKVGGASLLLGCLLVGIGSNNGVIAGVSQKIHKRETQKYITKYDNIDVNQIVNSKRLMSNYANCLLEKGPCTPEGRELKTYLPDAMATNCTKCSDRQKEISGIVLAHLVQNYHDLWDQLLDKYDPNGTFRKQYEGTDDEDEDYEDEEPTKK